MTHRYILTLSCPDRAGIIAAVSSFIAAHGGMIDESASHTDPYLGYFFTRQEIFAESLPFGIEEFREKFSVIAAPFGMDWQISDSAVKKQVVILVSKQDHCLADLLYRWRSQDFSFAIPCVISNHEDLRDIVEWHGIPYHYIAISAENKPAANQEIHRLFKHYRGDVMVLARYMQILPAELCSVYPGRIINIHHGLLPSFVGAKPYHQALARGVKQIGATSHYITSELDAGPIIDQDVIRVDHTDTIEDLLQLGRDVEKTVLSRAVRYHAEDRVLVHGNKTVVFK